MATLRSGILGFVIFTVICLSLSYAYADDEVIYPGGMTKSSFNSSMIASTQPAKAFNSSEIASTKPAEAFNGSMIASMNPGSSSIPLPEGITLN